MKSLLQDAAAIGPHDDADLVQGFSTWRAASRPGVHRTALDPVAFTAVSAEDDPEHDRSIMQIQAVGVPESARLMDLGTACKLDNSGMLFADLYSGSGSGSGRKLGDAVVKSSICAENASGVVLKNFFGQGLDLDRGGGEGVGLHGTHEIPLGSLARKTFTATRKSCEDFSTLLLHRLEKPGQTSTEPATAAGTIFSARDATRAMKAYGLCLDSIGESAALQGCEIGHLQQAGSDAEAHLCAHVEGPEMHGFTCVLL